jgi:signal transduction histidine kinase/CheY-like chemotaxis protein
LVVILMDAPNIGRDDGGELASTFEQALAVEILESQAQRALVLSAAFAVATVFVSVIFVSYFELFGWRTAFVPLASVCVTSAVAVFEFAMHRFIKRHIVHGKSIAGWVRYASALVEITALSVLIAFVQSGFSNPAFALSTPPVLAYLLIVILSTLNLDVRLSLFTGGIAAAEYLAIVVYTFSIYDVHAGDDHIFLTPIMYVAKAMVLLLSGAAAAFVARELSRRQLASFHAAQERDREHRANMMKSQFLADMSHEIRTPLNAVIGYAQLLDTDATITPEQRKAIDAIRVGGRHLLAVVNDVLDISKIEAGGATVAASRFNLRTLLQELTLIFAARCKEKRLAWIFDLQAEAGDVVGDEAKLRQVLTNLLGNAVKFTEAGHVALRVHMNGDDSYHFAVEDTGPGIPIPLQKQIFDPFAQENAKPEAGGTGLGLAIAGRYVALMGGDIALESTPGAGAKFHFSMRLPRWTGHAFDAPPANDWQGFRLTGRQTVRALVADDVAANRAVLTGMLERAGVTVAQAEDGAAALAALADTAFDIAFVDIRMPDTPGTQLVQRLRSAGRGTTKLVAVSASVLTHQRAEYLAAGFDGVLGKPVQLSHLGDCLVRQLGLTLEPLAPTDSEPANDGIGRAPALPEPLWQSLSDAARRHGVTDLRRHIADVERMGPAERRFAARLADHCGRYDMEGLLAALEECRHG